MPNESEICGRDKIAHQSQCVITVSLARGSDMVVKPILFLLTGVKFPTLSILSSGRRCWCGKGGLVTRARRACVTEADYAGYQNSLRSDRHRM